MIHVGDRVIVHPNDEKLVEHWSSDSKKLLGSIGKVIETFNCHSKLDNRWWFINEALTVINDNCIFAN